MISPMAGASAPANRAERNHVRTWTGCLRSSRPAGDPNITADLLKWVKDLGGTNYKAISTATTRLRCSPERSFAIATKYSTFSESTLGAVRINDYKYRFIDQPQWLARGQGASGRAIRLSICASIRTSEWAARKTDEGWVADSFGDWYSINSGVLSSSSK